VRIIGGVSRDLRRCLARTELSGRAMLAPKRSISNAAFETAHVFIGHTQDLIVTPW